jgi:uncharacterized protein (TIGR03382 family)
VAGANSGDFLMTTPPAGSTACGGAGATLAPGMSCSLGVRFSPQATGGAGTRTATWNVHFTNGVANREITLQGTAMAAASPAPAPAAAPADSKADSGGATGWLSLLGLTALLGVARRRRID